MWDVDTGRKRPGFFDPILSAMWWRGIRDDGLWPTTCGRTSHFDMNLLYFCANSHLIILGRLIATRFKGCVRWFVARLIAWFCKRKCGCKLSACLVGVNFNE